MDKKEEVHEWLRFAEMDILTAEYLINMHPVPIEIICYHCQQSAEKYLKAFLIYRSVEFEKIHNLVKLCKTCSLYDKEIENILDECIYLNAFSTKTRYPDEMKIEEHHVNKALKYSQKIKKLINKLI